MFNVYMVFYGSPFLVDQLPIPIAWHEGILLYYPILEMKSWELGYFA